MYKEVVLSRYTFYKWSVVACSCIMLGFFLLFPREIIGGYAYRFIVAIYGLLLAFSTLTIRNQEYKKLLKPLNAIIIPYIVCVLCSLTNTIYLYHYSLYEVSISLMPYLYIFFSYPLTYIFFKDDGYEKLIKSITKWTLGALIIKGISWLIYTTTGTIVFRLLLKEYGDAWVRNGFQRVNAGYLVGVALVYCVYRGFIKNKRMIYRVFTIYIVVFLWFVTAYRFQFIVALTTVFVCLFFFGKNTKSRIQSRIALILLLLVFLFSPFVSNLIDSFRLDNMALGSSTALRLQTIDHFLSLMKTNKAILGLGLLINDNKLAQELLRKSQWRLYYLEDIGIIGAFFKLGILSLGIYGRIFIVAIKTAVFHGNNRNNEHRAFILGIVTYMLFSCLMLNIFDLQRAYDVPFYVSIILFHWSRLHANGFQHRREEISCI